MTREELFDILESLKETILWEVGNTFEEEPGEEEDEWPISDDPDNPENEP